MQPHGLDKHLVVSVCVACKQCTSPLRYCNAFVYHFYQRYVDHGDLVNFFYIRKCKNVTCSNETGLSILIL